MDIIRTILCVKPRLTGIIVILAGCIGFADLVGIYRSGGSFFSKELFFTPMMLFWGLAVVIEPRLLTVWFSDEEHPVPAGFRMLSLAILIIAGVIGLIAGRLFFGSSHRVSP